MKVIYFVCLMFNVLQFGTLLLARNHIASDSVHQRPRFGRKLLLALPLGARRVEILFDFSQASHHVRRSQSAALGKQGSAALINVLTYYVVAIPAGWVLTFKCEMGGCRGLVGRHHHRPGEPKRVLSDFARAAKLLDLLFESSKAKTPAKIIEFETYIRRG